MNTNTIKSFAKEARLLLLDGVTQRLKYWGFNEEGTNDEKLESTTGGYLFRTEPYTDPEVPAKWSKLKKLLTSKQAVQDIKEQAAYTWFNRLMAVKILEKNGYISEQLSYTTGLHTPMIVQNAKHGQHQLTKKADKELLLEYLKEDREELAFGLLITNLCNRNILLHNIFGRIDDYTEILLPQNLLQKNGLLDLINGNAISDDDYKQVELIGWLYQFYISDKKDEVFAGFKKNKKARAEDIPAATQIFTPKWIVKYMVENTVGKIYLDFEPKSNLKNDFKYLVENESDKNNKSIINDITQLTLMDPASGSGHILVTGFELLFLIYREEGYTARQAVENILKHNLFGLDIDDRAMQLARFAVLLKAAQYDVEILDNGILPHIYSFPEAIYFNNEELQNFLGHDGHFYIAELKQTLQILNQGKNIGSALKLEISHEALSQIKIQYQIWENQFKTAVLDIEQRVIWNRLKSFLDVLLLLTEQYTSVVANPPYMGLNNMNESLIEYLEEHFWSSRHDLSNVFIGVCIKLSKTNGLIGIINQQSWMFAKSYVELRKELLDTVTFKCFAHLGPHAFPEIKGEVVQSVSFIIKNFTQKENKPIFIRLVEFNSSEEKERGFYNKDLYYHSLKQSDFESFEQNKLQYGVYKALVNLIKNKHFLKVDFETREGLTTGDNERFIRYFHEVSKNKFNSKWFFHVKGGDYRKWYGNLEIVVNWENNGFEIKNNKTDSGRVRSHNYNEDYILKEGFTWGSFGKTTSFRYVPKGHIFDSSGSMGFSIANDNIELKNAIGYLNSKITQSVLPYIKGNNNAKPGHISLIPY